MLLCLQIAPIYLASCIKQGMGLLEILLSKQPVQNNQVLLKIIEICRLYELDSVSSNIMKVSITMNGASKEKTQAHIRSQLIFHKSYFTVFGGDYEI
ncbi:nuclear pore complex protein NUP85-like [Quercus suber]|uniref:nuclear pore complex protein NUP85-like n=1 Tax=Quercus suber TaxID=58331 RepID=UPI0032DE54CA